MPNIIQIVKVMHVIRRENHALKMEKNMKSKIVVDSSANVYELPDVGFACVPLKILTDEQEYVDTAEVDAPALAQMMRTYKGRTSTSCPNISDWMAAYEIGRAHV